MAFRDPARSTHKRGDGRSVREGDNYHGAAEPEDFDNADFLELALDSLQGD